MHRRTRVALLVGLLVGLIAVPVAATPRLAVEIVGEQVSIYSTLLQLRQTARDTFWEFSRGRATAATVRATAKSMLSELEPISPHLSVLFDEILEGWKTDPNAADYVVSWSLASSSNTALLRGYTELRSLIWLLDSPTIDRKAIEEQTTIVDLAFQDIDLALDMLRMFLFLSGDATSTQ